MNFILPLNIHIEKLYFKDINHKDLIHLTRWYNSSDDYKYATGMNQPVTLKYIFHSYEKAAASNHEFFAAIYLKNDRSMVGILRGNLRKGNKNIVWISQILIDKIYQRKGYGSQAIKGLLDYFSKNAKSRDAFAAVAEKNTAGRLFWEKMGFKEYQKRRGYFKDSGEGFDIIVMHKSWQ